MADQLTPAERAELNRLRQESRNRRDRRELNRLRSDAAYSKEGTIILGIIVGGLILLWPAIVWHGENSGTGGYQWNGATWTALGIWWGILAFPIICVVVAAFASAKRKQS